MKLNSIPNLSLKHGSDMESKGVSLPDDPREGTLCFAKSKRFLKELSRSLAKNSISNLGLIITTDMWSSEGETLVKSNQFSWIAETSEFDQVIIDVSKVFYDEKYSKVQNLVDGRQLGTCEIDPSAEISQNVFIGDRVKIGAGVKIYPGCVVQSEVEIEDGTILFSNVSIYSFTKIGRNNRIHSGTVIGADGFGYNFISGEHKKVWHFGGVEIGDNVEIGANSTVNCGTFIPTKVGDGCKFDDLCMVAHNVQVGKGVVMCGQSGIAGSSRVGDFTFISGHVAIKNDVRVGSGCQIAGASAVTKDIPDGQTVAGYPAIDIKEWRRGVINFRRSGQS